MRLGAEAQPTGTKYWGFDHPVTLRAQVRAEHRQERSEEAAHRDGENPGPGRNGQWFHGGRSFGEEQAGAKDIQELLGHTTLNMTMRYIHLTTAHKEKAVGLLSKAIQNPSENGTRMALEVVPTT